MSLNEAYEFVEWLIRHVWLYFLNHSCTKLPSCSMIMKEPRSSIFGLFAVWLALAVIKKFSYLIMLHFDIEIILLDYGIYDWDRSYGFKL